MVTPKQVSRCFVCQAVPPVRHVDLHVTVQMGRASPAVPQSADNKLDRNIWNCQHTWLYSMAKGGVPTPFGCTRTVPVRWPSQLKLPSQGCCLTAAACTAQDGLQPPSYIVSQTTQYRDCRKALGPKGRLQYTCACAVPATCAPN